MNNKISIHQLAESVGEQAHITPLTAQLIIKELFELASASLEAGEEFEIPGIGKFSRTDFKDNVVGFEPDRDFANSVNAPFEMFEPQPLSAPMEELEAIDSGTRQATSSDEITSQQTGEDNITVVTDSKDSGSLTAETPIFDSAIGDSSEEEHSISESQVSMVTQNETPSNEPPSYEVSEADYPQPKEEGVSYKEPLSEREEVEVSEGDYLSSSHEAEKDTPELNDIASVAETEVTEDNAVTVGETSSENIVESSNTENTVSSDREDSVPTTTKEVLHPTAKDEIPSNIPSNNVDVAAPTLLADTIPDSPEDPSTTTSSNSAFDDEIDNDSGIGIVPISGNGAVQDNDRGTVQHNDSGTVLINDKDTVLVNDSGESHKKSSRFGTGFITGLIVGIAIGALAMFILFMVSTRMTTSSITSGESDSDSASTPVEVSTTYTE